MVPGLRHNDAVLKTAKDFLNSFERPGKLLVAVSGGSDSTGLLLALAVASAGTAFSLAACTIDHCLRPESAKEADAVAALCQRLAIPHTIRRWDGVKPVTGLQAAARMARYRLLSDVAREIGAVCIVTGHTRDDQRETVAMRSARSDNSSAYGLSGMADAVLFERRSWVLRPFLNLGRADIRAFVSHAGERWSDDPSNANERFERVRVRQSLAAPDGNAVNTAHAEARWQSSARSAERLSAHVTIYGGLVAKVDPGLCDVTDSDNLRAILVLAAVLGGRAYPVGGDTALRVRTFLQEGGDGRITAGRVVFDRRRSGLYLYREARGLPHRTLEPGQTVDWDGRFMVSNRGGDTVALSAVADMRPVAAALAAAGLIEAVAKRAAKSALEVSSKGQAIGWADDEIHVEACIAPYDTFLPGFDRIMADRIADLLSRSRYLSSPVHIVQGKRQVAGWFALAILHAAPMLAFTQCSRAFGTL